MAHKIRTVVQLNGKTYTSPANAAFALAQYTAQTLAQPKYLDANPRISWDVDTYWKNYNRIEKRAYNRFLKVCKALLK